MVRKYFWISFILILVITGYYFFNRSKQILPTYDRTSLSKTVVSNVESLPGQQFPESRSKPRINAPELQSPNIGVCLELAALSAQSIESLDPTKKLRPSEDVILLPDISSGEATGFWVLLIDETTGLIGGLSTCVLDEGEVVPYDATPFEIPVDKYPPLSAESLAHKLTESGILLQLESTPRLVFVDRSHLSIPIYEVSLLSGKKAFYSGIDGSELTLRDEE